MSQSFESAAFAAISAGVAQKIGIGAHGDGARHWTKTAALHGATQGGISVLRGDKFAHGATAGLVSHSVGHGLVEAEFRDRYIRTAIASGVSALAVQAAGGDNAREAVVAALVHLFNAEARNGVIRTFYKKRHFGNSESRVVDGQDWDYRVIVKASDVPAGKIKTISEKLLEVLKVIDLQVELGTRYTAEQLYYREDAYDVYVDPTTYEPVSEEFNVREVGAGWDRVGPVIKEVQFRICTGESLLCSR